ncbi:ATP-dependent Clp protease proteolytic subunit [Streptomyces sp. NBC_00083]|uniref:ATP-dependent Clp protease proteolytic subunit n=1 Tax=Streptomyces sp. NBC_00083 TaxID=2975647 RepID=UPI00224E528E|nr:ATP-dependent Clp protease proteolytic subunit [Streptomyces sp. NBC_00083]MCX5383789.1 ATP-dependent Clp protease proteolytic subunit [Streptomyces sp. NBC_00083]
MNHRPAARHVLPEFQERTAVGVRTLDPYSKLFEERIVFLGTPVDDASANDVMAQLMHLEYTDPDRDISLYINSPGGSLTAMTAIHDAMRFVTCDVQTFCLGQVSAVAVLLAAGTPGKRMVQPASRVLLRQPALEEPLRGQPSDLAIQAAEVLRGRALLTGLLAGYTGRSAEQVTADIERDLILDAEAAVAYGLADHVLVSRKTSSRER